MPLRPTFWRSLTLVGWLVAIISIGMIEWNDRVLQSGQKVIFSTPQNDHLSATYYPGERPAGVLLLEGSGGDQVSMRSIASEFVREGLYIFTFDFSGQGRSSGTLAFDHTLTNRLAHQTLAAKDLFQQLSGLESQQILLLGHGLGARAALQSATLDSQPSAGLILIGTQVDLSASDAELDWVKGLGPQNPPLPIYLISGAWDDILTPQGTQYLLCKLAGPAARCQPLKRRFGENFVAREALLVPGLVHNYEIFSMQVISAAKAWAGPVLQLEIQASAPSAGTRIFYWLAGLSGIFLGSLGLTHWAQIWEPVQSHHNSQNIPYITITKIHAFLSGKLLLWLAALPLAALLNGFYFFLPFSLPVYTLFYVGLIGGYGLLMLLLYRTGRVPGIHGKLKARNGFESSVGQGNRSRPWWPVLAISLLFFAVTAAYARTGWFHIFPLNQRLIWLVLFTPPTAIGFWIGLKEMQMVRLDGGKKVYQLWLVLIALAPFFAWNAFLSATGSLSGLIGGSQGLLILALIFVYGQVIQSVGGRAWLTAILQSLLLYWLLLPQGLLFM